MPVILPRQKSFTGTFAAAKLFGSVNTRTIAPAKAKFCGWVNTAPKSLLSHYFAAAKTFTGPFAAAKIFTRPNLIIT